MKRRDIFEALIAVVAAPFVIKAVEPLRVTFTRQKNVVGGYLDKNGSWYRSVLEDDVDMARTLGSVSMRLPKRFRA